MGKDLKTMECFFFSAYCDIMMEATYRKLLVYLLLKPPITVNETTKIWSKQILEANNTGDQLCRYELFCNSGNVYERFTRNKYLANDSQTKVIYTYK